MTITSKIIASILNMDRTLISTEDTIINKKYVLSREEKMKMTGAEFKALRQKYGLSAKELGRILCFSDQDDGRTIRRIESVGPRPHTADHLKKTVKLYELTGKWEA